MSETNGTGGSAPSMKNHVEILRDWLVNDCGFQVGERDRRYKPDYPGRFMVHEPSDEEYIEDEWCIVGDDLDKLIIDAFDFFAAHEMYGGAPAHAWAAFARVVPKREARNG